MKRAATSGVRASRGAVSITQRGAAAAAAAVASCQECGFWSHNAAVLNQLAQQCTRESRRARPRAAAAAAAARAQALRCSSRYARGFTPVMSTNLTSPMLKPWAISGICAPACVGWVGAAVGRQR